MAFHSVCNPNKNTSKMLLFYFYFYFQENRWVELSIKMSNRTRLLSDGVHEDTLYALVYNSSNFYQINLKTNSVSSRSSNSASYSLGTNREAYLIRTKPDDFIVVATFGTSWYAYTYKANKWVKLSNWGSASSSAHFFFDPVTFHGFYHIGGRSKWEKVDMRRIKL